MEISRISLTDIRNTLGEVLPDVTYGRRLVALERYGKTVAYIVPVDFVDNQQVEALVRADQHNNPA